MSNNFQATVEDAMKMLKSIIKKARAHFYKPIQIAEILHRDRVSRDIDLNDLSTYRTQSKKWRDKVTKMLVGNVSTSSSIYQDNLFEANALLPNLISKLGEKNRATNGSIEKFIYEKFRKRYNELNFVFNYTTNIDHKDFDLDYFVGSVEKNPGLKRSIDKIYEIIVYALFDTLIKTMEVNIKISVKNPHSPIFREFKSFSEKIFGSDFPNLEEDYPAKVFRVGVANAADRGLDMWGNFGLAIQIKHVSISEEGAGEIVGGISADRIVIICKDADKKVIRTIISQLGLRRSVQSIITFDELKEWYGKAMRGEFADLLGQGIIDTLREQMQLEFPMISGNTEITHFFKTRGYS